MQEPGHAQTYPTELAGPALNSHQYDFANLTADLFQPEEIFQLDQPIKPDLVQHHVVQSDMARSPSTLLDLGSGTIHREFKNEDYWNQSMASIINDDGSNSSSSRFPNSPENSQMAAGNHLGHGFNDLVHQTHEDDFHRNAQFFAQTPQDGDYNKSQNFAEFIGDTKMFVPDLPFEGGFHGGKQCYNRSSSCEEKYVDLPQYVDYTSLLGAYENKLSMNERTVVNELDFRVGGCFSSNVNFIDNFDMLHQ